MTTFGISMVRDEADVIEGTLRHMAGEVDELIVANNLSTDGTRDILDQLAKELPLTVVDDPDPAYFQSRKMSALADQAAEAGADWIVPFDADEIWFARGDRVSVVLAELGRLVYRRVNAVLYHHFRTRFDDPPGDDPFRTMPWRQATPGGATPQRPEGLPKVAFRWEPGAVVEAGNHGVHLPSVHREFPPPTLLEVRHFPYRSAEQMCRKARNGAAAYAATDLPEQTGSHWRSYGRILDQPNGEQLLAKVYNDHFCYLSPTDSGLVYDPAPYRRWEQQEPPPGTEQR